MAEQTQKREQTEFRYLPTMTQEQGIEVVFYPSVGVAPITQQERTLYYLWLARQARS